MSATRVLGCAVNVDREESLSGDVYTISGEGAASLHTLCGQHALPVSALADGMFRVGRDIVDDELREAGDINRVYICNALKQAARGMEMAP